MVRRARWHNQARASREGLRRGGQLAGGGAGMAGGLPWGGDAPGARKATGARRGGFLAVAGSGIAGPRLWGLLASLGMGSFHPFGVRRGRRFNHRPRRFVARESAPARILSAAGGGDHRARLARALGRLTTGAGGLVQCSAHAAISGTRRANRSLRR